MSGIPEALVVISELHQALGRPPLNGGIGEYEFHGWRVQLNGSEAEQDGIPPFTMRLEFNGFPAGLVDPSGGIIAAGEFVNEHSFIAAARDAIKKAQVTP